MTKKLSIEGMTCNHCVMHVQNALKEVVGVKSVKVDLKTKSALIETSKEVDEIKLKEAVEDAGYEVTSIN